MNRLESEGERDGLDTVIDFVASRGWGGASVRDIVEHVRAHERQVASEWRDWGVRGPQAVDFTLMAVLWGRILQCRFLKLFMDDEVGRQIGWRGMGDDEADASDEGEVAADVGGRFAMDGWLDVKGLTWCGKKRVLGWMTGQDEKVRAQATEGLRVVAHRRCRLAMVGVTDPSLLWIFSPQDGFVGEGWDEDRDGDGEEANDDKGARARRASGARRRATKREDKGLTLERWEFNVLTLEYLGRKGPDGATVDELLMHVNDGEEVQSKSKKYVEAMSRIRFLQQREFLFLKKLAGVGTGVWLMKYADIIDRQGELASAQLSLSLGPRLPDGVWPAAGTSVSHCAFSILSPVPFTNGGDAVKMDLDVVDQGFRIPDPPAWTVRAAVGDKEDARNVERDLCECAHAILLDAGLMREDTLRETIEQLFPIDNRLSQYGKEGTKASAQRQWRRYWAKLKEILESSYGVQFVLARESGADEKKAPVPCAQLNPDHRGPRGDAALAAALDKNDPLQGDPTVLVGTLIAMLRMGKLTLQELLRILNAKVKRISTNNQGLLTDLLKVGLIEYTTESAVGAKHAIKVFRLTSQGLSMLEGRACQGDLHLLQYIAAVKGGTESLLQNLAPSGSAGSQQPHRGAAIAADISRNELTNISRALYLDAIRAELAEHGYCFSKYMGEAFWMQKVGTNVGHRLKLSLFEQLEEEKVIKMHRLHVRPFDPRREWTIHPEKILILLPYDEEPEVKSITLEEGEQVTLWAGPKAKEASERLSGRRKETGKRRVGKEVVDVEVTPAPLPPPLLRATVVGDIDMDDTKEVAPEDEASHYLKEYFIPAAMVRAKLLHIFLLHATTHAMRGSVVDWTTLKFPPLGGGRVAALPSRAIDDPPSLDQFKHPDYRVELEREIKERLDLDISEHSLGLKQLNAIKIYKPRIEEKFGHFFESSEAPQVTGRGDLEVEFDQIWRNLPDEYRAYITTAARVGDLPVGQNVAHVEWNHEQVRSSLEILKILGLVSIMDDIPGSKSMWLRISVKAQVGDVSPTAQTNGPPIDAFGSEGPIFLKFGHLFDLRSHAGVLAYWRCMEDTVLSSIDLIHAYQSLHDKMQAAKSAGALTLSAQENEYMRKISRYVVPYPVQMLPECAFFKREWLVDTSCPPLRDAFNADMYGFVRACKRGAWGSSGALLAASFSCIAKLISINHSFPPSTCYALVRDTLNSVREKRKEFVAMDPPEDIRETSAWKNSVEAMRIVDDSRWGGVTSHATRKENYTGVDDCLLVVAYSYVRAVAEVAGFINLHRSQFLAVYAIPALNAAGRKPVQSVRRYGVLTRDARLGRVCNHVARLAQQFATRIMHRSSFAAELRGEDPPYSSPAGRVVYFDAALQEVSRLCSAIAEGKLAALAKQICTARLTAEELEWAALALVLEPMSQRVHENYRGSRKPRAESGKRRASRSGRTDKAKHAVSEGRGHRNTSKSKRPGHRFCDIPVPDVEIGDDVEGIRLTLATNAGYVCGTPPPQPWKSKAALDWKFDANMGKEMLEAERKYEASPADFAQNVETPGDAMYALSLALAGKATISADFGAMAARARQGKSTDPGEAVADGCIKVEPIKGADTFPMMVKWPVPGERLWPVNPVPGHRSTWDSAMRGAFHVGVTMLCSEPFTPMDDFLSALEAALSSHGRELLAVRGDARRILGEIVKEDLAIVFSHRMFHAPTFLSCTPPQPMEGRRRVCVRSSSRTVFWLSCS